MALAGLWHVSASPRFCASCHIMEPYVAGWKVSPHRGVACVECHYPPGFRDTLRVKIQAVTQVAKWATGTYSSKPFAEVEDASCLRSGCHGGGALEARGPVSFSRGVRFEHTRHLGRAPAGVPLRCTSCHSQIVVDRHFEVTTAPCVLCHFKAAAGPRELRPRGGCTGCHEIPRGDIAVGPITFNHREVARRGVACEKCHLTVVEGAGEAPRERCLTCHNEAVKLGRYADTALLHQAHTAHSVECTRCHSEIHHRLPPPVGLPVPTASPAGAGPARP